MSVGKREWFCGYCGSTEITVANSRAKTHDCPNCGIISRRNVRFQETGNQQKASR